MLLGGGGGKLDVTTDLDKAALAFLGNHTEKLVIEYNYGTENMVTADITNIGKVGGPDTAFVIRAHSKTITADVDQSAGKLNFRIRGRAGTAIYRVGNEGLVETHAQLNSRMDGLEPTAAYPADACTLRLMAGDYLKSQIPCTDLLQYYKSVTLSALYGISYKTEATNQKIDTPALISFELQHDFSVGMGKDFSVNSCSASPSGDVYYNSSNPSLHQCVGSAPIYSAAFQLTLIPRDPNQPSIVPELPPGGSFELRLGFFHLK